ncbi:hybrid sensor histidine kinase/response regulator, partial [Oxalobacteraceae bacterium OM1]
EEVLGNVAQSLPQSRAEPHNQEHLTTLRRCFHTLKGSGRMVGLVAFGEAAWSIEQVLNLRLAEAHSGDSELYALLDKAAEELSAWVKDLQQHGKSDRTPQALMAAAERIKAREPFSYDASVAASVEELALPDSAEAFAVEPVEQSIELAPLSIDAPEVQVPSEAANAGDVSVEPEVAESLPMTAESIAVEASEPAFDLEMSGDDASAVAELSLELPVAEAVELGDAEMAMFAIDDVKAETDVAIEDPMDAAPAPIEAPPGPVAPVLNVAEIIEFPTLQPAEPRINDNVKRIGDLEISVPLHNIFLAETDELVRVLAHDLAEWRHEPERQVSIPSVHAAHSLAGSSATVGFNALHEIAHALELVLQLLSRRPTRLLMHEFDTLEQTVERMKLMLQKFALGEMPAYLPEYARVLVSLRQDIERRLEQAMQAAQQPVAATPVAEPESDVPPAVEQAPASPVFDVESISVAMPALEPVTPELEADAGPDAVLVPQDELDQDLLPVFFEEGRDILPQMGADLRAWVDAPSNLAKPQSLLRSLHTLKGSARMAGAMALGQHLHDMEARIENLMRLGSPARISLEDLLVRYDHALHMFEHLQNPDAPAPVMAAAPAEPEAVPVAMAPDVPAAPAVESAADAQPLALMPVIPVAGDAARPAQLPARPAAAPAAPAPAAPAPLVRVRADILDRLVNQAGEVSISRSKLETEVGSLRQSLSELTENVVRLRTQLREIEMQAETQIASQMAQSSDREFDPLEFDRFTRLQELTRMMAESVNDVGSVHSNLSRTLDSAVTDLTTQARLTRDLQQDLMRVRMVQFGSIAERLFRVTRQAAKEVDKRVNLDIRGGAVEIDRGVLEKMTGPFEHLLRNAIAHGVESREARRAAGKSETGELLVEVRQEGNEVVIRFSDDGQGLNIARIRDKATRVGLLTNDADLSDEEVSDLIFHPGFSTAEEVTELAGRGVGMDVVRSEAAALGGRVSTWSETGRGAHFTIHLPLTLAVTQVVLITTGGKTYAVPSVLVEQVQQLKSQALAAAYNDGVVVWQGQRVAMHYLATLLGDTSATPTAQQYSPLMILKSGNERVALHVDEIVGNREVVVKNIGPQLARLTGIAGATVLGSGDIVLILNPVPLAQRMAQDNVRAPRIIPSDAPVAMGAVAEADTGLPAAPESQPVQGLRTQNIVMVVDDSLTVRRVTQRLLAREGYQVVLSKDGVDALEHLQSVTPDVMLVDIEMPRMDGFDLTRNVRGDERTRHIPIIMITSRTAAKHRNYALELGVNEYLGKPYQEEQLLGLITGYVGKAQPVA